MRFCSEVGKPTEAAGLKNEVESATKTETRKSELLAVDETRKATF